MGAFWTVLPDAGVAWGAAGSVGELWAGVAIDLTLKATVLLLIAWGLTGLLARSTAALRHYVWLLAAAGLLALPFLSSVLPAGRVPLPAAVERFAPPPSPDPEGLQRVSLGGGSWFRFLAFGEGGEVGLGGESGVAGSALGFPDGQEAVLLPHGSRPPSSSAAASAPGTPPSTSRGPLVAAGLWGIGFLGFLTRLFVAALRVRRAGRRLPVPPPGRVPHRARRVAASLGIRRPVRLRVGPPDALPMTWGLGAPVLLLPSSAEGWPDDRLTRVLTHELAHVVRMDAPAQIVAELARAFYWFHPLAWLAASRLRVERELACDEAVVRAGARPSSVAEDLVSLARRTPPIGSAGAVGIPLSRPSALERRVGALLDARRRTSPPLSRATALFTCAAAALLVLPLSAARPAIATEDPAPRPTEAPFVETSRQVPPTTPIEIDPVPRITVPVAGPDDPEGSHRVVTPFVLPDGRLVVPLVESATLRVFLPDGELAQLLRIPGANPEARRFLAGAWPRGDTIEALEGRTQGVTRFLPDGTEEFVRFTGAPRNLELPVPGALPDGWLAVGIGDAGYDRRDDMVVERFDRSGGGQGEVARVEGMAREATSGISGPGPLSPRARFALHDGRLYVGETLTPAIRVFGPSGELEREIVWDADVGPSPDAAFSAVVDALGMEAGLDGAEAVRRRFEAHPVPERVPAYWDFLVDPSGFVWIRPFDPARHSVHLGGAGHGGAGPGGRWRVLSPGGDEAAGIEVPGDLELLAISDDAVIGVATDPAGARTVRVHDLRRLP